MSDDEGRLARWSRRKADARRAGRRGRGGAAPVPLVPAATAATPLPAEGDGAGPAADPDAGAALPAGPADAAPTAPATAPPELPAIDELDADSDYSGFLADGVPEALTRAALRKLWLSDPVFANLDGLNDYDENFNLIDRVIQAADTNYRVGRGMLTEDERRAEQAAAAAATDEDEAADVVDGDAAGDVAAAPAADPADDATAVAAPDADDERPA